MSDFLLPDVGEGLDQAEILEWLVAEGDEVARDQPLVEILTDKSQTQLPSPVAGIVTSLGAGIGDIVEVGSVLVTFDSTAAGAEPASSPRSAEPEAPANPSGVQSTPPSEPQHSHAPASRRPKASPAVRRRAASVGVDLTAVVGTGPGGRVTTGDLDAHIERPAPASPLTDRARLPTSSAVRAAVGQLPPGVQPLRGIRRATAAAMTRSWEIPHIHGHDELDASALLDARRALKQRHGDGADRLTIASFLVLAVADALAAFPIVNASIDLDAETITVHENINIGLAVAAPQGLVVPVINNADRYSLMSMADEIDRMTTVARAGQLSTSDMTGGTCTVTNYGSLGGRHATPIIRSPEVAIVGFGSIRERAIAVDGAVVARPTLPIAVGADHRLIDGDVMTAFQERIIANLTQPIAMLA